MSTRQTSYFLAPVGNPPEGPIRLGNIISTPVLADDPINEEYLPPGEASMEVIEYNQTNFTFDMSVKNDRSFGIWASFLQTLGIGGDATVDWSKERSEQWTCENLKTVSFSPKISYVSQCLKDEGVQSFMRVNKPWFTTNKLYMITGIKVAYGAASTIKHAKQRGLNLKFGTDFSSQGVPISLGPQIGGSNTISTKQSQSGAEPFVFAFRLRRIKISRKGEVNHERYTKGTLLGIKEDGNDEDVELVVEGVEDFDVDGEEFQFSSKDAFDEDSAGDASCKAVIVEED
ncbi:hypothetical protein F53441_8559 [Fusarium austroafricanum]|uniref:Uncharacterized protein n=1 Tax=Fusarium austroafricanum TaxID=2364996 RepID=A0A8H4KE86_9HYPO|nr:hypothetical protein F53441_8559 [Fusarium austroafricanum]